MLDSQKQYTIVLQARSSSKRLPGKSLMPILGVPLAVLCALRAKNQKCNLVVATSDRASDDALAQVFSEFNFNVYRGNLESVLDRFVSLALHYRLRDDVTLIRLTGDNPLVDCEFLLKMIALWEANDFDYLCAQPEDLVAQKWPKGLSAEFFSVSRLKESASINRDPTNLEHVTTHIRKTAKRPMIGMPNFLPKCGYTANFSIDELAEYEFVKNEMERHKIGTSYLEILTSSQKKTDELEC